MVFCLHINSMSEEAEKIMEENNQKAEADISVPVPSDLPDTISQALRKPGSKIRRIVVDRSACIGAQSCVVVAPGVFQMDDGNLAYIVDPDSEEEDTVLLAAQACPVLAIHLYDENGKKLFPES